MGIKVPIDLEQEEVILRNTFVNAQQNGLH
jgi:hypothetical protein